MKHFILLNDIEDSLVQLKLPIDIPTIVRNVVMPFRADLDEFIPNLLQIDLHEIRTITNEIVGEKYYVITMDNGSYFDQYDYNFDITRVAFHLNAVVDGPYLRSSRSEQAKIISQGLSIHEHYLKEGGGKPIALCDDGIGTGGSIRKILNLLDNLKIKVSKIFVFLNPNNIDHVDDNDIITLFNIDNSYDWLSERDMTYGLPRSGMTCNINLRDQQIKFGIPYTIDNQMIKSRIADFGELTDEIRLKCIDFNILLWEEIQTQIGKELTLSDIPRLAGMGTLFDTQKQPIVEYLESLKEPGYEFNIK